MDLRLLLALALWGVRDKGIHRRHTDSLESKHGAEWCDEWLKSRNLNLPTILRRLQHETALPVKSANAEPSPKSSYLNARKKTMERSTHPGRQRERHTDVAGCPAQPFGDNAGRGGEPFKSAASRSLSPALLSRWTSSEMPLSWRLRKQPRWSMRNASFMPNFCGVHEQRAACQYAGHCSWCRESHFAV